MLSPAILLVLTLAAPDEDPLPQLAPNGSFDRNVAGWKEPGDESNSESGVDRKRGQIYLAGSV